MVLSSMTSSTPPSFFEDFPRDLEKLNQFSHSLMNLNPLDMSNNLSLCPSPILLEQNGAQPINDSKNKVFFNSPIQDPSLLVNKDGLDPFNFTSFPLKVMEEYHRHSNVPAAAAPAAAPAESSEIRNRNSDSSLNPILDSPPNGNGIRRYTKNDLLKLSKSSVIPSALFKEDLEKKITLTQATENIDPLLTNDSTLPSIHETNLQEKRTEFEELSTNDASTINFQKNESPAVDLDKKMTKAIIDSFDSAVKEEITNVAHMRSRTFPSTSMINRSTMNPGRSSSLTDSKNKSSSPSWSLNAAFNGIQLCDLKMTHPNRSENCAVDTMLGFLSEPSEVIPPAIATSTTESPTGNAKEYPWLNTHAWVSPLHTRERVHSFLSDSDRLPISKTTDLPYTAGESILGSSNFQTASTEKSNVHMHPCPIQRYSPLIQTSSPYEKAFGSSGTRTGDTCAPMFSHLTPSVASSQDFPSLRDFPTTIEATPLNPLPLPLAQQPGFLFPGKSPWRPVPGDPDFHSSSLALSSPSVQKPIHSQKKMGHAYGGAANHPFHSLGSKQCLGNDLSCVEGDPMGHVYQEASPPIQSFTSPHRTRPQDSYHFASPSHLRNQPLKVSPLTINEARSGSGFSGSTTPLRFLRQDHGISPNVMNVSSSIKNVDTYPPQQQDTTTKEMAKISPVSTYHSSPHSYLLNSHLFPSSFSIQNPMLNGRGGESGTPSPPSFLPNSINGIPMMVALSNAPSTSSMPFTSTPMPSPLAHPTCPTMVTLTSPELNTHSNFKLGTVSNSYTTSPSMSPTATLLAYPTQSRQHPSNFMHQEEIGHVSPSSSNQMPYPPPPLAGSYNMTSTPPSSVRTNRPVLLPTPPSTFPMGKGGGSGSGSGMNFSSASSGSGSTATTTPTTSLYSPSQGFCINNPASMYGMRPTFPGTTTLPSSTSTSASTSTSPNVRSPSHGACSTHPSRQTFGLGLPSSTTTATATATATTSMPFKSKYTHYSYQTPQKDSASPTNLGQQ
ncbi:hypothetical protein HMI56_005102 [Coelomomyces lativittatus]|nr:hypothetical protein HMI56_005102 [Coelomomyces lativittatus]